jgi:hypothetical protein
VKGVRAVRQTTGGRLSLVGCVHDIYSYQGVSIREVTAVNPITIGQHSQSRFQACHAGA